MLLSVVAGGHVQLIQQRTTVKEVRQQASEKGSGSMRGGNGS